MKPYIIAGCLAAAGVIFVAVSFGTLIYHTEQGKHSQQRFVVPTAGKVTKPVTLTEIGDYAISYEFESVIDGRTYEGPSQTPALTCQVTSEQGQQMKLGPARGGEYKSDSYAGRQIWTFSVDRPGRYVIEVSNDSPNAKDVVLVVGRALPGMLNGVLLVVFASCICPVLWIAAGAIALITFFRRRRIRAVQQT